MKLRIHGVIHVRFDTESLNEQEAVKKFKSKFPLAEIQGIESRIGEYVQFVGVCEKCKLSIFQNQPYVITDRGVRHAESQYCT